MPLARLGCTTVLLRMKLFLTVESVALPLKFRPSASVERISQFSTVILVLPYWSQNPTLVSWIHRPFTTEPVPSEPLMALAVLSSCRPTVEPRIAKPLRLTGPGTAIVLSMNSLVLICEYQSPAPAMVALLTCSGELIKKVPGGIHTGSPFALAAEIALPNAAVESALPEGSAPSVTTDTELAGRLAAAGTS